MFFEAFRIAFYQNGMNLLLLLLSALVIKPEDIKTTFVYCSIFYNEKSERKEDDDD